MNLKPKTTVFKKLSGEEIATAFRDALPSMLKFISENQAPFIAKVYKDGKVVAWKDATDLLDEIES
ncbi:hypothetical protein [Coleofasciculus sp. E1-EBD-02]|uniref:hypothetical protein n=1 Tax=Coleofasciculus sp. E1-EBD-02 TaxID=3068481 RepID=UPI0032F10E43